MYFCVGLVGATLAFLSLSLYLTAALAISFLSAYVVTNYLSELMLRSSRLANRLPSGLSGFSFTIAITSVLTTALSFMCALALILMNIGWRLPTKFLLFWIAFGGVSFLTGCVRGASKIAQVDQDPDGLETLKQKSALMLEFLRTFMWGVLALMVLGIANQVLANGLTLSSEEFILIAYFFVGYAMLLLLPILAAILDLISQTKKLEPPSRTT